MSEKSGNQEIIGMEENKEKIERKETRILVQIPTIILKLNYLHTHKIHPRLS